MSEEDVLNKYVKLIDNGYCSDCNELNCIDNFPSVRIAHAIRKLQQENKELKEKLIQANKGLKKVILKRKKWKTKYYTERRNNKQLKKRINRTIEYINNVYGLFGERDKNNMKKLLNIKE